MIPYARQSINQADIDAVVDVLRGDWLTQGPAVPQFEQALATYCGAAAAVAVSSGTSALHLACRALGFGPGDTLWTSPVTFVSSANCALFCGGDVDFVDIDERTYNLCPRALARKLDVAERAGKLPKIVVPVHFAGQSCDMAEIQTLAQRYGFRVIEDASHALGGNYRGLPVGSCQYADITVFSFHPVKSITTGEGGALVCKDRALADRAGMLRSHGITRDPSTLSDDSQGGWYYEQLELGFNYRMTDLQAALGLSQLNRLDSFVARRRQLARQYDERLQGLPLQKPWQHPGSESAYHLYPVRFDGGAETRRQVFDSLACAGIRSQVHYIPVHLQPFYRERGFRRGDFPESERYYDGALSLPLFPRLSAGEQDKVVRVLEEVTGR